MTFKIKSCHNWSMLFQECNLGLECPNLNIDKSKCLEYETTDEYLNRIMPLDKGGK